MGQKFLEMTSINLKQLWPRHRVHGEASWNYYMRKKGAS